MMFHRQHLIATIIAMLIWQDVLADDEEPRVTPYRPTISNPADLSVPGYLELELGAQRDLSEDHSRATSLPYLLKYAFADNVGILLGGNAYVEQSDSGAGSLHGLGDTSILLKLRKEMSATTAFGLELGPLLPTSTHNLGTSKTGFISNAILSTTWNDWHFDFNTGINRIAEAGGARKQQLNWAGAVSRDLNEHMNAALEFSGSHQQGQLTENQILAAWSYAVSNRLVLDAGLAHGMNHEHHQTFFAGATVLLGKLN